MEIAKKIILGIVGDINFSMPRGDPGNWLEREKSYGLRDMILKRLLNRFGIHHYNYRSYPFRKIHLSDYGASNLTFYHDFSQGIEDPFLNVRDWLRDSDAVLGNLETPVSSHGRHMGDFNSDPRFLKMLAENNISILTVANNHIFDNGELGFTETLKNIDANKCLAVGGNINLEMARAGTVWEKNGTRIGFLAYADHCNQGFISLARNDAPGILPIFPPLIEEDISRMKAKADLVFVNLHFGLENVSTIHSAEQKVARQVVRFGADAVLGGHSHIPKAIEVFEGKPIIYSLGNFIFPYRRDMWTNNIIGKIKVDGGKIQEIDFFEVNAQGAKVFQPEIVKENMPSELFRSLQRTSRKRSAHLQYIPTENCLRLNTQS